MLTPSEQESLRRDLSESSDFAREHYRKHPPLKD
jgi:hypothetical protein